MYVLTKVLNFYKNKLDWAVIGLVHLSKSSTPNQIRQIGSMPN